MTFSRLSRTLTVPGIEGLSHWSRRLRAPVAGRPSVEVSGELPPRLVPGQHHILQLQLRNRGTAPLRSSGDEPVQLASRWFDATGSFVEHGPRTRLWPALWPGRSRALELMISAPRAPGRYELRVTPVRENVAWFDDMHPQNALRGSCEIAAAAAGNPDGLPGLTDMIAQVQAGPPIFRPSAFWEDLCSRHVDHLQDHRAFEHFKRTVNFFYFQFPVAGGNQPMYRALVRTFLRHPTPRVLTALMVDRQAAGLPEAPRFERPFTAYGYALYVAMLAEVARRRGAGPLLDRIEEPALGRPLAVRYRGRRISQDLANSTLELAAVLEGLPRPLGPSPRILEIGGGYGRVAHAVMSGVPGARYVLVDIPPALALAQRYLTTLFADLPAFRFRRFSDGAAVADELAASRLAFLTPDQLELVEPLGADVAISISSLHEMVPDLVRRYLELVDEHCDGVFYTKQWQRWHNPVDDLVMAQEEYPYPATWARLFERPHPVQQEFFEALFATRP